MNEEKEELKQTPPPMNPGGYIPISAEPGIRELFEALLRRPGPAREA